MRIASGEAAPRAAAQVVEPVVLYIFTLAQIARPHATDNPLRACEETYELIQAGPAHLEASTLTRATSDCPVPSLV